MNDRVGAAKLVKPFENGEIQGVRIRRLKKYQDERGWLAELFRADEIESRFVPAMSYVSETLPGQVRGPHEHKFQTDYFCFVGPSTFKLVLWDNRRSSNTYWFRQELLAGESNPCTIIVPEGIVHAYRNVGTKPGLVVNFPNRLYAGEGKKEAVDEIRYEADTGSPFRID